MLLTDQHSESIAGVISCYDRIVIQGTLPGFCFAQGMSSYLTINGIRIFDYPHFAEPLRDALRKNAEQIAKENELEIEFIRKKNFRKEDRIRSILNERGEHPGLVHIFSAMEICQSYKPWHDKKTHKTYLKPTQGKCLPLFLFHRPTVRSVLCSCSYMVPIPPPDIF